MKIKYYKDRLEGLEDLLMERDQAFSELYNKYQELKTELNNIKRKDNE